jgi:hypothetical protein
MKAKDNLNNPKDIGSFHIRNNQKPNNMKSLPKRKYKIEIIVQK